MSDHLSAVAKPLEIIYITSRGHSGSTLLTHLISSHSLVFSGGELKMLSNPDPSRKLCSCHKLVPSECPFWSVVESRLIRGIGKSFSDLTLLDGDHEAFAQDNLALFRAISEESRQSIIVDSSKTVGRLKLLLETASASGYVVRPIHLHRGPFGSLNSARKRGADLRATAYNYVRLYFLTNDLLRSAPAITVFYERLARQPRIELKRLMNYLGLSYEDSQLAWRSGIRRDVHGNNMRFGVSEDIRLDQSWVMDLTLSQKFSILIWTLPVRIKSRWLFMRMKKFIKQSSS